MISWIERTPTDDVRPPEEQDKDVWVCACGAESDQDQEECSHCHNAELLCWRLHQIIQPFSFPTGCDYSDRGRAEVLREVAEHLEAALTAIRKYKEG